MNEPCFWPVVRLGALLKATATRGRPDLPLLSVVREKGVIVRDTSSRASNHNFIPDDLSNYKVVESSHLAINKMKAWSGSLGISEHLGIVSPAYYVFETSFAVPRFAHYLLRSRALADEFARCSDGIRVGQWDLSIAAMKNISIALPSPEEQELIVRYLDNAELRIARAIQAKRVLLSFLAERREVTVTNLVLGSTNADAQETWFGSLPTEWQVLPARALFRERIERGQPDLPLLSVTIKSGVMLQSDYLAGSSKRDQSNVDRSSYKVARPGDIVYNKMRAWQGAAGLSRHLGIVSPAYVVQTPQALLNPAYAEAVMRIGSFAKEAERLSYGITSDQWSLRPQHFKQILFPVPPRLEQDRVCVALDAATRDIDAASDSLEREIDLLREYRMRLISDVVTGKKDVRAEASGMKDVDSAELANVLAGVTSAGNDELGEEDDA